MKGLLKNLGLILIVVGVVILVACSFTGNVNNNAILGSSAVLVVVGLISYIVINKRDCLTNFKRKAIKNAETNVQPIFYFDFPQGPSNH